MENQPSLLNLSRIFDNGQLKEKMITHWFEKNHLNNPFIGHHQKKDAVPGLFKNPYFLSIFQKTTSSLQKKLDEISGAHFNMTEASRMMESNQGPFIPQGLLKRLSKGKKKKSTNLQNQATMRKVSSKKYEKLNLKEDLKDSVDEVLYNRNPWCSPGNLQNFERGNLSKLVNGRLRAIEDLRMEDFNASWHSICQTRWNISLEYRLCWARVSKIQKLSEKFFKITFTVHPGRKKTTKFDRLTNLNNSFKSRLFNKKSTVHLETTAHQPYFVFAESWASLDPVESFEKFGLICKKLETEDDCMILLKKSSSSSSTSLTNSTPLYGFHQAIHINESASQLDTRPKTNFKCPFTASFLAEEDEATEMEQSF